MLGQLNYAYIVHKIHSPLSGSTLWSTNLTYCNVVKHAFNKQIEPTSRSLNNKLDNAVCVQQLVKC